MPTETIRWRTLRKLPKVIRRNVLTENTILAREVPSAVRKAFHPVMFTLKEITMGGAARNTQDVVPGRFFTKRIEGRRWWSLQGTGFYDNEIIYWAEVPKGPHK